MAPWNERIGQSQFSTLISIAVDDIFDIENHKIIKHIHSTRNPFSFQPTVIIADPFLFVHKNELYLFYEEQVCLNGKGVIKMTKTSDLKRWNKPKLVLSELFHLSFPNVFEINGQIFMMPETGYDNSIKLYTPNSDLTKWMYHKTLIDGRHFVDSSIIIFENRFFLFTTDFTDKTNVLKLYFADSIDGNWTEHPKSPIANGSDIGRCAGSLFFYNDILFRPCQLTGKRYGEGAEIYKVTLLSTEEYQEKKIKSIIPNANKNYKFGGHHFNIIEFKGKIIVATDILEIKLNFTEILRRIIKKYFAK